MIKEILSELDNNILEKRDKKAYRVKGFKRTCIKTIMGDVEYDRRVYKYIDENGKKNYRYLLDEYLNIETIGKISSNLVEKMVLNATELSFRKSKNNIKETTNQDTSHTAIWRVIQILGNKIEQKEDALVKRYGNLELNGKKEVSVLFEETDGIWLYMQGKDRPKKGKKRELKLAVTYEGWKKRNGSKETYEVINKRVCAGFVKSKEFKLLRDAKIAENYNVDEIKVKIINADGAEWAKEGHGEEGVYFQLDPFHKSQAVIRNVSDKKEAGELIKQIHGGEEEKALKRIEELKYECGGEEHIVKKLQKLLDYFMANRDFLRPYHLREDINMPKPPEGVCYRHLGTMEHNVCDVCAQRMKNRKASWSIKGSNNLAKILAEKASGTLYSTIHSLLNNIIPDNKFEEIVEVIKNVADTVVTKKKNKKYPIHEGKIPFTGCSVTEGRKAIREIFEDRCATELVYK